MADVVGGEVFGGLEIDSHQIADRVVVLDAVEPSDRHPTRIGDRGAIGFVHDRADAFQKPGDFSIGGSRALGGWHLSLVHHLQRLLPDLAIFEQRRFVVVDVEDEVRLFRLDAVALDAVVGQERFDAREAFPRAPGGKGPNHHQRHQQSAQLLYSKGLASSRLERHRRTFAGTYTDTRPPFNPNYEFASGRCVRVSDTCGGSDRMALGGKNASTQPCEWQTRMSAPPGGGMSAPPKTK